MIFRVYDHYYDNHLNCIKPDECFICYEVSTDLEICPISLKSQNNYYKQCGCDGWIHKQCLDKWFNQQKKCPVCRLEIYERKIIVYSLVSVVSYSFRVYIIICNALRKIVISCVYFFLICAVIEFYLTVILIAYKKHLDVLPYSDLEFNNSKLLNKVIKN